MFTSLYQYQNYSQSVYLFISKLYALHISILFSSRRPQNIVFWSIKFTHILHPSSYLVSAKLNGSTCHNKLSSSTNSWKIVSTLAIAISASPKLHERKRSNNIHKLLIFSPVSCSHPPTHNHSVCVHHNVAAMITTEYNRLEFAMLVKIHPHFQFSFLYIREKECVSKINKQPQQQ